MDSFNKVISFVLGLVVVLVFLAVITGKLNLKSKPFGASSPTPTATPTPTQKPSTITVTGISGNNLYKQNDQTPKSIPATGLPTLFIPMLLSGLVGGGFLRKSGKNK